MKSHVLTFLLCCTACLLFAQQKGGYYHQWNNYPSGEFGPVNITFDTTNLRSLLPAPATGIHPRVFFNPSEVPDIKTRWTSTTSGQAVFNQLHAYTTLLHLGYSSGGYSHNATYAKDTFGNRYIDNAGKWDSHQIYYDLIQGMTTSLNNADNKRRYLLSSVMALEALECLVLAGDTDMDTGLSYNNRATDLAKAMSNWAQAVIGDSQLNPNNYHFFGGMHMAMCYDLNYNSMTTNQRDSVRMALAAINPTNIRYGATTAPHATTSNWCGLNSFELVTNLAIEGEAGYNPLLTEDFMRAYRNFITYGWYASGTPYEGLGKNYQFVVTMIAAAKRGYSLLGHPNVTAYGQNFLPAIVQPYGHAFSGTDVWGGSGWDIETGGYKFNASDMIGLKWMYPNDSKIDFVWRNYIEKFYKLNSSGYVYQQIEPATSGYFNYLLLAAIFSEDYTAGNWENQNSNTLQSNSFFAPERGLAVMRNTIAQDDIALHFHCRQDLGGHTHGDRNNFTLSGLGRIWMRYTYGSNFQETKYHSCILIDSLGVPITLLDGQKARQPGKVLNFDDQPDMVQITGDATHAYSYEWHWQNRPPSQDHSWLGTNGWEKVTETWNDFRYQQGNETYHNTPFYDFDNWRYGGNLERMVKRAYNPMQRVYRTAALVRGEQPFVLIVDDVQKDSLTHLYQWLGQVASDLTISQTEVNLQNNNYKNDVILSEPNGNRKLLVRVLNNNGQLPNAAPAVIDTLTPGINGNNPITRLKIEANAITPDFKVMLFPFEDGDSLPHTAWNTSKDTLTVTRGSTKHAIAFEVINDRTHVSIQEIFPVNTSNIISESMDMKVFPNPTPHNFSVEIQSELTKHVRLEVVNALGQSMYSSHQQIDIGTNSIQINADQWSAGTYFIQLIENDKVLSTQSILKY